MKITDYHAKYFAYSLTRQHPINDLEGLIPTLMDAQVDLNPHQIEAALFAFSSPLSRGAILADEVGLGKTIEAGIVLSQKWAERKRKILIIVPSSLRKQWNRELLEKFFLQSTILDSGVFNKKLKDGNPFEQDKIIICSYQFARNKSEYVTAINWDLVIIDEAHRLRNVYKKNNKIARELRIALKGVPKILLTATPLQNSLMELYGLTSFIDEYAFGDENSFKEQYTGKIDELGYDRLKKRLSLLCKRNLRRQVKEYVKYTRRIPITQDFTPEHREQVLYERVSEYLQRPNIQALPPEGRQLVTMVLRKLLASSTFAIAGALNTIINRLESILKDTPQNNLNELQEDFEAIENIEDEWEEDENVFSFKRQEREVLEKEIEDLKEFHSLATSIEENAKGQALVTALETGFKEARDIGANEKAIVFTESRRTQEYIVKKLSETQYGGDGIVLFNGSNTDEFSKNIYEEWKEKNKDSDLITGSKTADMRSALVDYFKNKAKIMIATEAASEGINLQFCSLILNYDLPWNPQRIEQRIGRCHRYGQKHDVVVINFLNRKNAADKRVFELLKQKFHLFEGVFGASDEVLGTIESGVDFEKRVFRIYQKCRSNEEIEEAFNELQEEMSSDISENIQQTKQKLIENFDEEVIEKLRVGYRNGKDYLNNHQKMFWRLSKHILDKYAGFHDDYQFTLKPDHPFSNELIPLGTYEMVNEGKSVENNHVYRFRHPLALEVFKRAKQEKTPFAHVTFVYAPPPEINALKNIINKSGHLELRCLQIKSFESMEEHLIISGITDDGQSLQEECCRRIFSLSAIVKEAVEEYGFHNNILNTQYNEKKMKFLKK